MEFPSISDQNREKSHSRQPATCPKFEPITVRTQNLGVIVLTTSPDLHHWGCSPMHPMEGLQSGLDVLLKRESGIKFQP
jgi:hypothetical protein